jgi:alpha-methylacyl-CoA racemase
MILADLGADVIRIDRTESNPGFAVLPHEHDLLNRGKRSIAVDAKKSEGAGIVLSLAATADALIEGYRPGVMERLRIGPAQGLARNPKLVYGRVTGWGQQGPLAGVAGHDIDYIAMSGALSMIGSEDSPVPPLNLVGDYGGGGMLLAVGVLAGIISARATGVGQVVDAAMIDGSALLTTAIHALDAAGVWTERRGQNLLDGGTPFYAVYETADGLHLAVGALEPQFFTELIDGLGLEIGEVGSQTDRSTWPHMRELFADTIATRSRDEWEEVFAGRDACVAPVLTMAEAHSHPANLARGAFVETDGMSQPAPAPRFSGTPTASPIPPPEPGEHTDEVLALLGLSQDEIGKLRRQGAVV